MSRWINTLTLLIGTSFARVATSQMPVIMTANAPEYNFQVLAGSQRQISVKLVGGIEKTVDWSIESVVGRATATLDRGRNAIGVTNVSFGPGSGECSIRGGLGSYEVISTASVTVIARSVDDPSQKATFLFNVCANTTNVEIVPAYQQAFKKQPVELQSWVVGNTDESGKWSITAQPKGGDGRLKDESKRDTIFEASITGRYTLRYISVADPTKTGSAIVYVSPNALPEYVATTSLTQPTECYPDPALRGTVYEVGPEFPYKQLRSVPTSTWKEGSIVRIHNVDTTGAKPTTYHEAMRIMGNGTEAQPLIVCGVPDHAGNLPIIDGEEAQLPSWDGAGTQGYGVINIWGRGTYNGTYSDGSGGPEYIVLAGLAIAHAGVGFDYTSSENGRQNRYVNGASCVNVRSGTHILIEGIDMDQCSNGLFIANNSASNGFSTVTRFLDVRGNRMRNSGVAGDFGSHDAYIQSWYTVIEGNRFENLVHGAKGDALKDRGIESIIRYNLVQSQNALQLLNFESETDSQPYIAFEPYLGMHGDRTCKAIYCGFDKTLSADRLAAYQESLEKDFVYGNILSGRSYLLADVQYGDSGGGNTYEFYNQTEMGDHLGRLYFYNNTDDQPGLAAFATLSGTNNGASLEQQFLKPTVIAINNIFFKTSGVPNIFAFTRNASFIGVWQTNLMNAESFSIAAPITGMRTDARSAVLGWDNYTDEFQYPLDALIDKHQTGLSEQNFLSTSRKNVEPYNPVTFAPIQGAGAVDRGSEMTDPVATLLPVRSQYRINLAALTPRTDLRTIGAVDEGEQPRLMSITIEGADDPGLENLPRGPYYGIDPLRVICVYSDNLSTDCADMTIITSSNPIAAMIIAGNKILPNKPGSGTITATLNDVKSQPAHFNVK